LRNKGDRKAERRKKKELWYEETARGPKQAAQRWRFTVLRSNRVVSGEEGMGQKTGQARIGMTLPALTFFRKIGLKIP